MFGVAAKAGLGFVLVLAILGAVSAHSLTESLMLFITVGLVPGTNFELAPEFMLLAVGAALMVITVLFFRSYNDYRATLDAIMPEYVRYDREDPDYQSLVPGLGKLIMSGRSAMSAMNDASVELYFWFRSFGRPAIAQAVTPRKGWSAGLVRLDRITPKASMRENLQALTAKLQSWSQDGAKIANLWADRARYYWARFISS